MEGTIGEIRLFAGTFEPRNWAYCAGQLVAIRSNTALFSILGNTYGGDGINNFMLPDLRNNVAIGAGNGPGLTPRPLGNKGGTTTTVITGNELAAHVHMMLGNAQASSQGGTVATPTTTVNTLAAINDTSGGGEQPNAAYTTGNTTITANTGASGGSNTSSAGGNTAFSLEQPYLAMNYIICMFGLFPPRS